MKKKKNEAEEKVYSIEELAEFIHNSEAMHKDPKKPMSLFTKILIFIIILSLGIFIYFKFIYVPYIFTIDFKESVYTFGDYTFTTKNGGEVTIGTSSLKLDDNISKILMYKDYSNLSRNLAIFLSDHGNLYMYDIDEDNVIKYYGGDLKVASIDEVNLDNILVIEATFEDGSKKILGIQNVYNVSVDDVKIMDKIIYSSGDIYIYLYKGKLYTCKYSEVEHYDIAKGQMISSDKITKLFVGNDNEELNVIDYDIINNEGIVYIYIITKNGDLGLYKLDLKEFDSLSNRISMNIIKFNSKLESFEKDSELINGVRIKIQNYNNYIDVIKDMLAYGSLSNDKLLLAYVYDLQSPKNYILSKTDEGNNKFKINYNVIENDDYINIVYVNNHDELTVTTIYYDKNKKDETRKVKLEDNVRVNKIYSESGNVIIQITKTIHKDYVVFESETEYITELYSLNEFLKGVEYYE